MHAMHLDDRDAGAALSLVREVGEARTLDEFADVTMAGLLELVPGIDTSYKRDEHRSGTRPVSGDPDQR